MLHAVVETFLESVTEREFDAPLLAILAANGCTDVHFIHGGFEFGKDVIAKRRNPESGALEQLAIQSKAGEIRQSEWRAVRPQLEECEYNARAHPSFDETLPRKAVLVTTGRLRGAAATDAQEYRESCEARGLAGFEAWDRDDLIGWMSSDPQLGLAGGPLEHALLEALNAVHNRRITESELEAYSRSWLLTERPLHRSSLALAVMCHALRRSQRLDLAALFSLHLLRAAEARKSGPNASAGVARSALRLFESYAAELLEIVDPLLNDPRDLARPLTTFGAAATYPAACCRLAEVLALLALVSDDDEIRRRAAEAVRQLAADHPGTARPPNDSFAVSVLAVVVLLARSDRVGAVAYLKAVSEWLLDRYDPDLDGLGLASIDEDEELTVARLLGGRLTTTELDPRTGSYLATVVLDLLLLLTARELYEGVRANLSAMQVVPSTTMADEVLVHWRRGGQGVWRHPRIEFGPVDDPRPSHFAREPHTGGLKALALALVCRSRHYPRAIEDLLN